jgi:hypothetical protein
MHKAEATIVTGRLQLCQRHGFKGLSSSEGCPCLTCDSRFLILETMTFRPVWCNIGRTMSDSRIDRRRHSYHFPHSPSDSPHRHEPIAGPSRAPNAGKTPSIILSAPAAEASIPVNEDHIDHSRSEIGTPLQRTPSQVTQKSYDHTDDPYLQEPDPHHDERATQIDRQKGTWDVLALVLNKMIGTGIFTVPGLVLALTQSTRVSVGLWVAGGLYTAAWYICHHALRFLNEHLLTSTACCCISNTEPDFRTTGAS